MPSPFVTDNSTLPFPKSDRAPLPAGAVLQQHLTAAEYNQVCQSIIDVRAWFISGSYYGFLSSSTMPNVQMGLSGTVSAVWLSSSLHPYISTTSSSGLLTRKIALTPTGTNYWTGYWDKVLVDEQGVVVSGTIVTGAGGGYDTIASGANVALPTQTRLLFSDSALKVYNDAGGALTRVEHVSSSAVANTYSSIFEFTIDAYGHITNIAAGPGSPTYATVTAVSITSSAGIKTVDLEVTRNATLLTATASSGIKALDLEATRNLTVGGNASFVSLTGSGGGKFLDIEVTRNSTVANLTASAGVRVNHDLTVTRNFSGSGNTQLGWNISGSGFAVYVGASTTLADPVWFTPTLLNSWANYGTPYQDIAYTKDITGRVQLRGLAKNGTTATPVFQLPAGYRPAKDGIYPSFIAGTVSFLTVYSNGDIAGGAGNSSLSLEGISFYAETSGSS